MKQNLNVRQAIAETLIKIPAEFKTQYETFLTDASYQTKEIALLNLCKNFPEERENYLTKTKNIIGNNDKSFRISWLSLALVSEKEEETKSLMYKELLDYSSTNYESSIRQNALEVLLKIYPNDGNVIALLFQATTHHKWQFTKFSREKIRELLKKPEFRSRVEALAKTADEKTAELYLKFLKE
jgi:aminopeptidase N